MVTVWFDPITSIYVTGVMDWMRWMRWMHGDIGAAAAAAVV